MKCTTAHFPYRTLSIITFWSRRLWWTSVRSLPISARPLSPYGVALWRVTNSAATVKAQPWGRQASLLESWQTEPDGIDLASCMSPTQLPPWQGHSGSLKWSVSHQREEQTDITTWFPLLEEGHGHTANGGLTDGVIVSFRYVLYSSVHVYLCFSKTKPRRVLDLRYSFHHAIYSTASNLSRRESIYSPYVISQWHGYANVPHTWTISGFMYTSYCSVVLLTSSHVFLLFFRKPEAQCTTSLNQPFKRMIIGWIKKPMQACSRQLRSTGAWSHSNCQAQMTSPKDTVLNSANCLI